MLRSVIIAVCFCMCAAASAQDASNTGTAEPAAASANPVAYDRTAPNAAGTASASASAYQSNAMAGRRSAALDDPFSFGGVGKQEDVSGKKAGCQYKAVMTDDEIATCKAVAAGKASRSSKRRR